MSWIDLTILSLKIVFALGAFGITIVPLVLLAKDASKDKNTKRLNELIVTLVVVVIGDIFIAVVMFLPDYFASMFP